jgi:protein-disulfide isomerase
VRDVDAWQRGLDDHAYRLKVAEDISLAQEIGLSGTPAFFINAVFIEGAVRPARFQAVVDAELKKAEAKVASGTPKDRVYVVMSQENAAHPPREEMEGDDDEDTTTVWRVPAEGPARGGPEPLVTLVEFGDFEDRFTRRAEATLSALRTKYGDDLRVVWRNEPLPHHGKALAAAKLAAEARAEKGDAGFWAVHDALLAKDSLDEAVFADIAKSAGLDEKKAKDAVTGDAPSAAVNADLDVMDDFDAFSTPTFFIDGRRLVGAHPQRKFEALIDDEIKKAKGLVDAGTPRARVYQALIADGKDPPPPEVRAVGPAPNAPWKGTATAKVVVETFSDFQCPFCGRAEPTVAQLLHDYAGRIKLVWRNLPLPMHADAPRAAEAALEAFAQKGQDGFWKMHDAMFSDQDHLDRATLDHYAKDFGLDMVKWAHALDDSTHAPEIDADMKAAEDAHITGTPAFVVFVGDAAAGGQGYFIGGAHPYVRFRKLVERALAEAAK